MYEAFNQRNVKKIFPSLKENEWRWRETKSLLTSECFLSPAMTWKSQPETTEEGTTEDATTRTKVESHSCLLNKLYVKNRKGRKRKHISGDLLVRHDLLWLIFSVASFCNQTASCVIFFAVLSQGSSFHQGQYQDQGLQITLSWFSSDEFTRCNREDKPSLLSLNRLQVVNLKLL